MRTPAPRALFRFWTLLVLSFVAVTFAQGQVYFSVRPDYLKQKREGNNVITGYRAQYPDTTLTFFDRYAPRNFLGNMGLASPSYFLSFGTSDLGFRLYGTPYESDKFNQNDIMYFRSAGPYASITGAAGSKNMQMLRALFTHTYRNGIGVTLGFRRSTSDGFYRRQEAATTNFFFTSNYETRNRRFGYYLYFLNNNNKHQENGGIADSTLTDSTLHIKKELIPERITQAGRENRENRLMFNPYFRLTNKPDSALSLVPHLLIKSRYSSLKYVYSDNGMRKDTFYRFVYLDTARTYDSTHHRQLSNEIAFSLQRPDRRAGGQFGYRHEINQVYQFYDSVFTNQLLAGEVYFSSPANDSNKLRPDFRVNAQYVLNGPNAGDYRGQFGAVLNYGRKGTYLFFDALTESRRPDAIYQRWISNHFFWTDNGFHSQQMLQAQGGFSLRSRLTVSAVYQAIDNYLYFDTLAMPAQLSGPINNFGLRLEYNDLWFHHIGFAIRFDYQSTSSSVVRLPEKHAKGRLYYQALLFGNRLQLQFGGEAEVFEKFSPYDYMPATQAFYQQNYFSTERYPFVDVFFSARIRPVSIFLKIENVLQGSQGPDYAFVPRYYQPDRAFRFGINWMFFD
jgi:hypothetical protein